VHWKILLVYLDDVIVISPDFSTHVSPLREVFDRLRVAGLKLLSCSRKLNISDMWSAGTASPLTRKKFEPCRTGLFPKISTN